jgi:hypothetical protein
VVDRQCQEIRTGINQETPGRTLILIYRYGVARGGFGPRLLPPHKLT